jgi:phosphatidylglycerophosphatase A
MQALTKIVATFFGIGYIPLVPATWASAAAAALTYYVVPSPQLPWFIGVFTVFGLWACLPSRAVFKSEDPKHFVMDEVCGQMITLLFIPFSPELFVAGFFLFRFFDVFKPWPISRIQASPHPWSIMLDDLLAGVFANLCLRGIMKMGWLS